LYRNIASRRDSVAMIKRMLVMLDRGSTTLSGMARQMDITEAELKNRLEMMVRMGHLESVPLHGDDPGSMANCPGCILASRCKVDECSGGPPVVGYRLTDKGRRLARGVGRREG
jgi:DNA-binding HxlR family transcriptional regulator